VPIGLGTRTDRRDEERRDVGQLGDENVRGAEHWGAPRHRERAAVAANTPATGRAE
jgi:hypothetical protein